MFALLNLWFFDVWRCRKWKCKESVSEIVTSQRCNFVILHCSHNKMFNQVSCWEHTYVRYMAVEIQLLAVSCYSIHRFFILTSFNDTFCVVSLCSMSLIHSSLNVVWRKQTLISLVILFSVFQSVFREWSRRKSICEMALNVLQTSSRVYD